jgi:hypothetical protein
MAAILAAVDLLEAREYQGLARAERLCAQLHACLPRHVSGIQVQDTDGLAWGGSD